MAFWLEKKFNIDFQDGSHGGWEVEGGGGGGVLDLNVYIAIFDLQVA